MLTVRVRPSACRRSASSVTNATQFGRVPATCRGRRRRRTARSRGRCRRSRRRRRTRRSRRRASPAVAGSASTAAIPPAAISSRIDGTIGDVGVAGDLEELLGLLDRGLGIDRDRLGPGRPVPERRHLAHRRRSASASSVSVVSSVQYGAHASSGCRRRRRAVVGGEAVDREPGGDGTDRGDRERRPAPLPAAPAGRRRARVVAAGDPSADRRPSSATSRQLRRRDLHHRRQDGEIELVERPDERRSLELVERRPRSARRSHGSRRRSPTACRSSESSIATQSARSTPSWAAASRYGSGCGLPRGHVLAGHDRLERTRRQLGDDRIDEAAPRHRHQRARHAGLVQLGQQPAGTATPRHAFLDLGDDTVEQAVDDLVRFERNLAVLGDVGAAVEEIRTDQRVRVLVGPCVAVRLDEARTRC